MFEVLEALLLALFLNIAVVFGIMFLSTKIFQKWPSLFKKQS